MLNIIDEINRKGYVLKYQISFYPAAINPTEMNDSIIINDTEVTNNFSNECVEEFGGLSQTDTHMSTGRLSFGDDEQPNVLFMSKYYKRALPVFEDMINTCQSEMQFQKAIDIMINQHYHNVASNEQ